MDLIDKYHNAYRFTYEGNEPINILYINLNPHEPIILNNLDSYILISNISEKDRKELVYEKLYCSNIV